MTVGLERRPHCTRGHTRCILALTVMLPPFICSTSRVLGVSAACCASCALSCCAGATGSQSMWAVSSLEACSQVACPELSAAIASCAARAAVSSPVHERRRVSYCDA